MVEVVLTGELDISTFDKAEKQIEEAEQEAPDLLIIDLAELQFVDSTGVRLILLADQRAQQAGRRLAIRLGRGQALRVFTMLGITDRFDVLDEEANGASPGPTLTWKPPPAPGRRAGWSGPGSAARARRRPPSGGASPRRRMSRAPVTSRPGARCGRAAASPGTSWCRPARPTGH